MIKKKYVIYFLSIFFVTGIFTPVKSIGVTNVLRWVKQKFVRHSVSRGAPMVAPDTAEDAFGEPIVPSKRQVRSVRFENNIPRFFDSLKDDPAYAEVPSLMDQTILVNGRAILPGTTAEIEIENGKGVVTIKLHKGFSKLIYAMQKGPLRGILVYLLSRIEPWIQWQYNVTFAINEDIDSIQLSELVLVAYDKSQDQNAVNHRFQWILVVDLSLNETVEL
jgi:hypothetical protein